MSVKIEHVTGTADLFVHYKMQTAAQPSFIYLDCERKIFGAGVSHEIGNAVPVNVFNKLALRWNIPPLTAAACNSLLDSLQDLAQQIVEGFDATWKNSRYVGTYTDQAQNAIDEIERRLNMIEPYPDDVISEMYVSEWGSVGDYGKITAETTDEQIDEMAEKYLADVPDNIVLADSIHDYLRSVREECKEENRR